MTLKRAFLDTLKDKPCADCGRRFPPVAMDLDHRPDETKLFAVSHHGGRSLEDVRAEAAKCDVVCAICHRLRTAARGMGYLKARGARWGRPSQLPETTRARVRALRESGLTLAAIAKRLNSEGVLTAGAGPRGWNPTQVRRALA